MKRAEAAIGSALFLLAAPGVVAGLIPFLITGWRVRAEASLSLMLAGAALIAASGAALADCFVRFARSGGTPAPIAPTPSLVIAGLYRHVRNPMYLAVAGLIFGQMLVFQHAALLAYGVAVWTAFLAFVLYVEEPRLRRDFPEAYDAYCRNVGRWLPRLTAWRAEQS